MSGWSLGSEKGSYDLFICNIIVNYRVNGRFQGPAIGKRTAGLLGGNAAKSQKKTG